MISYSAFLIIYMKLPITTILFIESTKSKDLELMLLVIRLRRIGIGPLVDTKIAEKHIFNKQRWTKRKISKKSYGEIIFLFKVKTFFRRNAKISKYSNKFIKLEECS